MTLQGYSIATTSYLFLKAFREGLKTKIKMTIISMPQRTLVKVAESIIMIEDYNEEEKQKPKKKETKDHSKTIRKRCVLLRSLL